MLTKIKYRQYSICENCLKKNKRLETKMKAILKEFDCKSMFVTWNEHSDEFTVFTGGSNMSDEFDCCCTDD